MSNHHLQDKRLSLKAKGLLSYMLSLPDDWDYSLKGLTTGCRDGIDSVRSAARHTAICRQKSAAFCYTTLEKTFFTRGVNGCISGVVVLDVR